MKGRSSGVSLHAESTGREMEREKLVTTIPSQFRPASKDGTIDHSDWKQSQDADYVCNLSRGDLHRRIEELAEFAGVKIALKYLTDNTE